MRRNASAVVVLAILCFAAAKEDDRKCCKYGYRCNKNSGKTEGGVRHNDEGDSCGGVCIEWCPAPTPPKDEPPVPVSPPTCFCEPIPLGKDQLGSCPSPSRGMMGGSNKGGMSGKGSRRTLLYSSDDSSDDDHSDDFYPGMGMMGRGGVKRPEDFLLRCYGDCDFTVGPGSGKGTGASSKGGMMGMGSRKLSGGHGGYTDDDCSDDGYTDDGQSDDDHSDDDYTENGCYCRTYCKDPSGSGSNKGGMRSMMGSRRLSHDFERLLMMGSKGSKGSHYSDDGSYSDDDSSDDGYSDDGSSGDDFFDNCYTVCEGIPDVSVCQFDFVLVPPGDACYPTHTFTRPDGFVCDCGCCADGYGPGNGKGGMMGMGSSSKGSKGRRHLEHDAERALMMSSKGSSKGGPSRPDYQCGCNCRPPVCLPSGGMMSGSMMGMSGGGSSSGSSKGGMMG
jgi:hypothetical protein